MLLSTYTKQLFSEKVGEEKTSDIQSFSYNIMKHKNSKQYTYGFHLSRIRMYDSSERFCIN